VSDLGAGWQPCLVSDPGAGVAWLPDPKLLNLTLLPDLRTFGLVWLPDPTKQ